MLTGRIAPTPLYVAAISSLYIPLSAFADQLVILRNRVFSATQTNSLQHITFSDYADGVLAPQPFVLQEKGQTRNAPPLGQSPLPVFFFFEDPVFEGFVLNDIHGIPSPRLVHEELSLWRNGRVNEALFAQLAEGHNNEAANGARNDGQVLNRFAQVNLYGLDAVPFLRRLRRPLQPPPPRAPNNAQQQRGTSLLLLFFLSFLPWYHL